MFIPTTDPMTTGAQFASSEAGKTSMKASIIWLQAIRMPLKEHLPDCSCS